MTKLERARALLNGWLEANAGRAGSNPQYLAHLIWQRAKQDRAFKYALIRYASRQIAAQALTCDTPPYV